ncbi:MAG: GerAB/ArcD/ProY family transporter [Desulfocucumaceae bacterium]
MAGRDTWMVGIPFILYGIFFLKLMFSDRVSSQARGLAGRAVQGLGPAGYVLVLLSVVYLFVQMVVVITDFSDFFSVIMPRTPILVFRGSLLLLTTIVLLSGVEVLGRVALILLPLVILFILGGLLGNIPSFDFGNLLPLMEDGPLPVARAGFLQLSYASELFALGFFAGQLGLSGREVRKAAYKGFAVNGMLFFLVSVFLFGVLGESYAVRVNFKLFSVFHYGLPTSATGYDGLFILVWVTVFFVKTALLQGAISAALAEITPYKRGMYHLIAGGGAFLAALFAFGSRTDLLAFYSGIYPPVSLSFTLLFFVLVWLFPGKDKGSPANNN